MPGNFSPLQNHFLAAMPAVVREQISPSLELEFLPFAKVLFEAAELLKFAYFPIDSVISLQYTTDTGDSVSTCIVGNDGLLGVPIFMGGGVSTTTAVVQSAGHSYRMPATIARREFDRNDQFMAAVLRYTQARLTQIGQSAACYRYHSTEQRLCRLLLLFHDCLSTDCLTLTQEALSALLGVRRESVTFAAGHLQTLGIISYRRGHIQVRSRKDLEQQSCECYAVVKTESDRLMIPARVLPRYYKKTASPAAYA